MFLAVLYTDNKWSAKWASMVIKESNNWLLHLKQCLKPCRNPRLMVKYENLKSNLKPELRRIVDFLGYNYTESDLNCTVQSNVEQFHRKHTSGIDPYSPEQKELIYSQIRTANGLLSQYNITYPVD